MGKSYCPGWSQTVDEGNFWAKTPAYLCGNQQVSQVILRIIGETFVNLHDIELP